MTLAHRSIPPPQKCRAVIFDFDGTLFDTTRAIVHSFQSALQQHGLAPVPARRIRALVGRPLYEMFSRLVGGLDENDVAELIRSYRETFMPVCVRLSRPMPGLHTCLQALSRNGVQLAIVTNRLVEGAFRILQGFGLESRFATIVGLEHVRRPKPDPEPIHIALARLGVQANEALGVGDTTDDLQAYRAARVHPILLVRHRPNTARFDRRTAGAVSTIRRLDELLARLGFARNRFRDRRPS